MSQINKKKILDEYECSGPRPPVPGEESRLPKMIENVTIDQQQRTTIIPPQPPSHIRWQESLTNLLEDRDGVTLFKSFVEDEGPIHADRLNFYFACEGLKQQTDPARINELVLAIYKFIRRKHLAIPDELRHTIKTGILRQENNEGFNFSSNIFDQMQHDIEKIINTTTYPHFLYSDIFIQYLQQIQNNGCTGTGAASVGASVTAAAGATTSTSSSSESCSLQEHIPRSLTLPTLHEDKELSISDDMQTFSLHLGTGGAVGGVGGSGGGGGGGVGSSSSIGSSVIVNQMPRLTKNLLLATEKNRLEIRPQGAHGYSVYTTKFSSVYNPVSRQDSDRQSCSSGGITDSDTMSRTSNSFDGRPHLQRRASSKESKEQNIIINKMTDIDFTKKPLTQQLHGNTHRTLNVKDFTEQLQAKLQAVFLTQEQHEAYRKKLQEATGDTISLDGFDRFTPSSSSSLKPTMFNIDSQQQMLSKPSMISSYPQGKALADAITERLQLANSGLGYTTDQHHHQHHHHHHIIDDDNDQAILDEHVSRVWADLTPHRSPGTISPGPIGGGGGARRKQYENSVFSDNVKFMGVQPMKHSKSMPEQAVGTMPLQQQQQVASSILLNQRLTNKWPSMNTDSGISLFSSDTLMKSRDHINSRTRPLGIEMNPAAASTSTLEEARRILESKKSRKYIPHSSMSQQQSSGPNVQQLSLTSDYTTAVYTFCDEELPYRSKIPGTQPTLKTFKDFLPKKGNFRFFFKTACEDPDNPVIQEEIVNDSDILPLFEGKVMGLVKPFEL